jgi:hypothetical protein
MGFFLLPRKVHCAWDLRHEQEVATSGRTEKWLKTPPHTQAQAKVTSFLTGAGLLYVRDFNRRKCGTA